MPYPADLPEPRREQGRFGIRPWQRGETEFPHRLPNAQYLARAQNAGREVGSEQIFHQKHRNQNRTDRRDWNHQASASERCEGMDSRSGSNINIKNELFCGQYC